MLESSNDEFEKIFFLYKNQPAIVFINNENKVSIGLYKKHYLINDKDIKNITNGNKWIILTLKNNKKKIMPISDFKQNAKK